MAYQGDIRLGDTIDFKFTTRQVSGAPFTLAGSPVLSAYVGNGTTEITAGITLSVDFDSRTGLNNARVVASSGNGFATATNVDIVITTGTVNSVSVVGEVVGSFSIENRSALMPTTAARTLDVSATGEADANLVQIGADTQSATDLKDFADAGYDPATNKVQGVVLVDTLTTYTGNTPQTGDSFARIGVDGAGLTNINLPNQTFDLVGNITGNLSGSVGSVTGLNAALLDAAITTRMATYTQPTGFLAATFPVNVASTTNITGGTITTVTNLTNAPTAGDFTATMKTSLDTANATSWTTVLTESYATNGSAMTPAQALYAIQQWQQMFDITGTSKTVYQLDGTTPAFVGTFNDATNPSASTRA